MVYNATQIIYDAFRESDFQCKIVEGETSSAVIAGIGGENVSFEIRFVSTDNENDVAVRVFDLCKFKADKHADVVEACNQCNNTYRYVRFTADDDNTVTAAFDVPLETENIGKVCVEMLIRCMRIVDEAYPSIMRAIYS